jgi:hypothetical protein
MRSTGSNRKITPKRPREGDDKKSGIRRADDAEGYKV